MQMFMATTDMQIGKGLMTKEDVGRIMSHMQIPDNDLAVCEEGNKAAN